MGHGGYSGGPLGSHSALLIRAVFASRVGYMTRGTDSVRGQRPPLGASFNPRERYAKGEGAGEAFGVRKRALRHNGKGVGRG